VYSAIVPHVRNFWLLPAVLPLVCAVLLILLRWTSLREEMVQGGSSAPLTDDGFDRVAAWRSNDQMVRFIERLVAEIQASVKDGEEMRSFAARCFRNGRPRLTLSELRAVLKGADWIEVDRSTPAPKSISELRARAAFQSSMLLQDGFVSTSIQAGALVLVDGRYRATVKRIDEPNVVVEYDEPEEWMELTRQQEQGRTDGSRSTSRAGARQETREHWSRRPDDIEVANQKSQGSLGRAEVISSTASDRRSGDKNSIATFTEDTVQKQRVSLRLVLPPVPKSNVPPQLEQQIQMLCIFVDDCKRLLCPAARFWGTVLSWQCWVVASVLVTILLGISTVSTAGFVMESQQNSLTESGIARAIVRCGLISSTTVVLILFLALFLVQAKWFVPIRSCCRILWRIWFMRRKAPAIWPFFTVTKITETSAQHSSAAGAGVFSTRLPGDADYKSDNLLGDGSPDHPYR